MPLAVFEDQLKINSICFRGNLAIELEGSVMTLLHCRSVERTWVIDSGQNNIPISAGQEQGAQKSGPWGWSHPSHPCCQTFSLELPLGQSEASFHQTPHSPPVHPRGK